MFRKLLSAFGCYINGFSTDPEPAVTVASRYVNFLCPGACFPVLKGLNHMQFQIRHPKEFAALLEYMIEEKKLPLGTGEYEEKELLMMVREYENKKRNRSVTL